MKDLGSRNLAKPIVVLTVLAIVTNLAAHRMRAATPASVERAPAVSAEKSDDSSSTIGDKHKGKVRRVIDEVHFIPAYDAGRLEEGLESLDFELGVDVRFIFTRNVRGSLDDYAVRRARELGVGRAVDKRGLLFVYDVIGQRMRIEVGPGLQDVFTDAFVGYLMREQTGFYFVGGHRVLALKTTLGMVAQRLREAALNDAYHQRPLTYVKDSMRLAGGGGAGAPMPVRQESGPYLAEWPSAELQARFSAQPTVEEAYARYLEALGERQQSIDLPLYGLETHTGTKKVPIRFLTAQSYGGFYLASEAGQEHKVVERGDVAIMIFTKTPLISPHLFRRSSAGWHVDIVSEHRDTNDYFGGWYTWDMELTGDAYSKAFADLYKEYHGYLRPIDGDNRRLPRPKKLAARAR